MHEQLKSVIGNKPRPKVKVHKIDRHEHRKHYQLKLEKQEFTKPFIPKSVKVAERRPDSIREQLIQNPVGDVSQYPFRCIGICFAQNGDSSDWTIGALVGPNYILTASNAINWVDGGWSMQFIPAYANGNAPFGVFNVTSAHGYPPNGTPTDSYMVCLLDEPAGNTVGWFGCYASTNGSDYQNVPVWNAVGYPNQTVQIEANFTVTGTSADGGSMDLDNNDVFITPGWDGGPVWTDGSLLPNIDLEGPCVCAIVAGYGTSWSFFPPSFNQWQINEGGIDMVNLIFWAQDNWTI